MLAGDSVPRLIERLLREQPMNSRKLDGLAALEIFTPKRNNDMRATSERRLDRRIVKSRRRAHRRHRSIQTRPDFVAFGLQSRLVAPLVRSLRDALQEGDRFGA